MIYYYFNDTMPLFLLALFAKNEKANLNKAQQNDLASLTEILKKSYGV